MRCKLVEGTKENLKATVESLGVRGKMDLKPVIETVQNVIDDIRENGDAALLKYTEKFDGARLDTMLVSEAEIEEAMAKKDYAAVQRLAHELEQLKRLVGYTDKMTD